MDFNIESRIDCLCSVAEVKHGSLPMEAQAIISVDSCIAKRRPFCGFEKLKARRLLWGLCVLWELHTKELQVKLYVHYTSYNLYVHYTNIKIPTSTINSRLYHSKYRMNPKTIMAQTFMLICSLMVCATYYIIRCQLTAVRRTLP